MTKLRVKVKCPGMVFELDIVTAMSVDDITVDDIADMVDPRLDELQATDNGVYMCITPNLEFATYEWSTR